MFRSTKQIDSEEPLPIGYSTTQPMDNSTTRQTDNLKTRQPPPLTKMGNGATAVYLSLYFPVQGQPEFSTLVCQREYLELVLGYIAYKKGVTSRGSINVEVMADVAVQAIANNDPRFMTGPPTLHGGLGHQEILARFTVLLVLLLRRPSEPWKYKQNHETKKMCCDAFALLKFCERSFGGKQAERSRLVRDMVDAAAEFAVAIGFSIGYGVY
jgi:hypothetical protein